MFPNLISWVRAHNTDYLTAEFRALDAASGVAVRPYLTAMRAYTSRARRTKEPERRFIGEFQRAARTARTPNHKALLDDLYAYVETGVRTRFRLEPREKLLRSLYCYRLNELNKAFGDLMRWVDVVSPTAAPW